jgi:hypothetical protein
MGKGSVFQRRGPLPDIRPYAGTAETAADNNARDFAPYSHPVKCVADECGVLPQANLAPVLTAVAAATRRWWRR